MGSPIHGATPSLLGRYEVVGFLAAGGMAEVFLGRFRGPSGFERPVVLKRVLPHLAREASFVDMFLDEARIVARIQHPNVVAVNELNRDAGELFMVMEYLEGESLAGLVRRLIAKNRALPAELAAHVVAEACAGLHAAHELKDDDGRSLGVVHRDISPQNVFVTFAGGVKVLDFGVAKAADRVSRTETGQLKGKLDYMSPEQCLTRELDRRSDVFSLGVVLYELLTRRRLFKRPTPLATMKAITEEPIVPPSRLEPGVPKALDAICLKALARTKEGRYASCAEMRRELVAVVAASGGEALPEERLGALMLELFADRKAEKEEMLRRVREGSKPTALPAPEADDAIEIPVVVAEEPPAPAAQRGRSSLTLAVAAGIVLVGSVAGVLAWRTRAEPAAPTTASAVPSARPVHVVVDSTPAGATVTIDGRAYGSTPLDVPLPAGSAKVDVALALDGYAPTHQLVGLDADQHLALALVPSATPAQSATPPIATGQATGRATARPKATTAATHADDPLHQKW